MFEIWKLNRLRAAIQKSFEKDRDNLKKANANRDEIYVLDSQECFEMRATEVELDTQWFGVAFNSFQSTRCGAGRTLCFAGKISSLSDCLRFAPGPS